MCVCPVFGSNRVKNCLRVLVMITESHCDNQTSLYCQPNLYWLAVSSALDTQTNNLGWKLPQKGYCHGS